jgi:hypothetical protein
MQSKYFKAYITALAFLFIVVGSADVAHAKVVTITSTSPLPNGTEFTSYSYQFTNTATGGATPPYSWSIQAGSLPAGLSLDPISGVLSGTPDVSGTFSFSVMVEDSSSPKIKSNTVPFTLTVIPVCIFRGTNTGSISFGTIDPSTSPGPVTNNSVTQQVLFQCDTTLAYSFMTIPANPSLLFGSNSIPFTLGFAAPGGNTTNLTPIPLFTAASSILKPNYQNAVAGSYTSGNISVTISWGGAYPGSIGATVIANGVVINTCTYSTAGILTFNIDPSVSGSTSATVSPDMFIQCTNGDNIVTISASSQNGGASFKLNCSSPGCGSFQIPYTFKILNSDAWPVSAPGGTGFGGAGTPLSMSGTINSADYVNAPVGTYTDVALITINY